MKAFSCALAVGAALAAFSAPAQAVTCISPAVGGYPGTSTASAGDVGSGSQVVACIGNYNNGTGNGNNLLNNSGSNPDIAAALLGQIGLTITGSEALTALNATKVASATTSLSFGGQELSGITYIGIHWGGNLGTSFYELKFDAPTTSIDLHDVAGANFSGGVLYSTGGSDPTPPVPEPASWAMLVAGLGAVGVALRRRKVAVSFA